MFNQDPTIESLAKEIKTLSQKVSSLESGQKKATQLDRNLDNQSKDIISQNISDRALDLAWSDYYYYSTFFDSLDGTDDSGSPIGFPGSGLFMSTSAAQGNVAYITKAASRNQVLTFDGESRFRTVLDIGYDSGVAGNVTSCVAYLGTGARTSTDILSDGLAANAHYGFYLGDSTLYGICSNGNSDHPTSENSYTALPLVENIKFTTSYAIEARHYPGIKVSFFVSEGDPLDGTVVYNPVKELGSISTNLPTGVRSFIYHFAVGNNSALGVKRNLNTPIFELAQKRTIPY
jgi:hypothetical protein